MRIDSISIRNFKGFKELECSFHPQFNLIVGENATGKTALLDALSVAAGGWFLGLRGYDTRHIRPHEVLLVGIEHETIDEDGEQRSTINWEAQYPCKIEATGELLGLLPLSWYRSLDSPGGRTTSAGARKIKKLAAARDAQVRSGKDVVLPLVSYYGTSRLWNMPRDQARVKNEKDIPGKEGLSRLEGYRDCLDGRVSVSGLVRWIADQAWITFDEGGKAPAVYRPVRDAMIRCLEGARDIRYYRKVRQVIVELGDKVRQPFDNLSDGQRCMLAMVGDIAMKAATLNPHLGPNALEETPGVVLIDELDLHLHPKWQRHVIEDLRTTFPKIQFFVATHSPQLISEVQPEHLLLLRREGHRIVPQQCGRAYGLDSNYVLEFIMGTESRPKRASDAMRKVEDALDEGQLDDARRFLDEYRRLVHGDIPDTVRLEATINNLEALSDEADTEED